MSHSKPEPQNDPAAVVAKVLSQLKSNEADEQPGNVNCTIKLGDVWTVVPKIINELDRKYKAKLRDGSYELEVRVGKSEAGKFVPGVPERYFYKVRHRLQRHNKWFLGMSDQGTPKLGIPTTKVYRTLVFEKRRRVRVPLLNGVPHFPQSEVMRKTSVCKITFHLEGKPMGFRIGIAEEKMITAAAPRRFVLFTSLLLFALVIVFKFSLHRLLCCH